MNWETRDVAYIADFGGYCIGRLSAVEATLTAMFAYLASEDPTMITRINPDSARMAFAAARPAAEPAAGRGRGFGGPRAWPECEKAPRSTNARLR